MVLSKDGGKWVRGQKSSFRRKWEKASLSLWQIFNWPDFLKRFQAGIFGAHQAHRWATMLFAHGGVKVSRPHPSHQGTTQHQPRRRVLARHSSERRRESPNAAPANSVPIGITLSPSP